jgi:hypothetical protein
MQKITPFDKNIISRIFSIAFFLFTSYIGNAQVGIGTTTPLSTFEVNGSNGQTVTTVTSDLTLDTTHSVIICNNGTIEKTITLPTAIGSKGRIYSIKRGETSTANVTIATSSSQMIDGEINLILTRAKEAVTLISDGSDWKIIGTFTPQFPAGEISYFDTTGTLVSITSSTTDGSSNMFLCNPATTLSANSSGFSMTANGRLKYIGTTTRSFQISCTISAVTSSTATYIFEFKKTNTSFLNNSRVIQKLTNSEAQNTTIQVFVTLAPNDYLELWAGNIGGTGDVSIKSLNLFALGI